MKNILYYKYVKIENPEKFREEHQKLCDSLNLKGKILVAKEGINGSVSGKGKNIEKYKKKLCQDPRFSDIVFKEAQTRSHNFEKMIVRIRKEIITSNDFADVDNAAQYVEPKQLKKWLDDKEDFILLDARNDYESELGRFKNAIKPKIKVFSRWPEAVKKLSKYKDKKIVTYCTGGIRCEKASAFMKEHGFTNVFQLHGGILNYGKECGNSHWEGKCFVFDERVAIDIDPKSFSEPITICRNCRMPSFEYHNCALIKCDKHFISCNSCFKNLRNCCSKRCMNSLNS